MIYKKIPVFIFILLLQFSYLSAQSVICGYDMVMDNIKEHPQWYRSVQDVFDLAKQDDSEERVVDVYTVPVTFHIVWKDSIENIDDSLLVQQIEVLNEAYRRTNDDKDNIRPEFADIVGDSYIQFELANVIRTHTDTLFEIDIVSNSLADYVKVTESGGSDAIDPKKNLNIWICSIQPLSYQGIDLGVLLGYAYPPNNLDHWPDESMVPKLAYEGVVLDYKTIGRDSPFSIEIPGVSNDLYMEGLTAVHEVGHYLGLRHIWGDANGFLGEDGCKVDDGVDDTPNCATQSNFNCSLNANSCVDTMGVDLNDMVENYMDYSIESCMNSFTNGQISIMRTVLRNQRCELMGDCSHVGLDPISSVSEFSLSPNPVQDVIHIESVAGSKVNNIQIYNSFGALVGTHSDNLTEIDVAHLASGIYYMKLAVNYKLYTQKFIKR